MSHRRFTDDQEREIKTEYESGVPMTQIAARFGVPHITIRNALKRQGTIIRITNGRPQLELDPDIGEWITKLRRKGRSQQYIANKLGVSQSIVSRFLRKLGLETNQPRRGERHGMWKGGIIEDKKGYLWRLLQPNDEFSVMRNSLGYVAEHRFVMAHSLGRPLTRDESVHHINGDKQDNRIENLQLRQGQHGNGVSHVCLDCGSHNIQAVKLKE